MVTVRLISNKFFFLSAVIIAVVARYPMERGLRTDFLQRRVIDARRAELQARIARLGTEVEASVAQVRRQAADLVASRAGIVAAADAERHRIGRAAPHRAQTCTTAHLPRHRQHTASTPGAGRVGPPAGSLGGPAREGGRRP